MVWRFRGVSGQNEFKSIYVERNLFRLGQLYPKKAK